MNKKLLNLFRIAGTLFFLYVIFIKVDFASLFSNLSSVDYALLAYGFFIFYVMQLISTFRWYMLLTIHKLQLRYSYLFHANAISMLSGFIVPTNFGTDVVRFFYAAKKKGIDKKKVTVGTAGDRAFGMFTMSYMLFFSLIFSDFLTQLQKYIFMIAGFLGTILLAYMFFKRRKIIAWISDWLERLPFGKVMKSMLEDVSTYKNHELIKLFIISLLINLMGIYYNYILLLAVGVSVPFILVFIAYPIKRFVNLLPISLGGIGANEVTMWTLLASAGVTIDQIIAYSALTYIILIISSIIYMVPGFLKKDEV